MKKSLLATVAAVALIAGTGLAAAQSATEQQAPKAGASEMKRGGAEMGRGSATTGSGAGAEQRGDKAESRGSTADKADRGAADNKAMNGNRSTTGSGAAENKADTKSGQKAEDRPKSSTTGQGATEPRSSQQGEPRMRGERQNQPGAAQNQRGQNQPGTAQERSQSNTTVQDQASGQGGTSVNLTQEQKTKIRTTVIQSGSAPKISRNEVNFNVRIGSVVPRTVKFVAVPPTLVEIHPQWRGYRYFIVDEEIVIIDPNTLRIVAVLEV